MGQVSITEAGWYVGVSPITIKRWYKWWSSLDEQDKPPSINLPQVFTKDKRGTWYFNNADLQILIDFRDKLPRGAMSNFNAQFWGKYGKQYLKRKKEEEDERERIEKAS